MQLQTLPFNNMRERTGKSFLQRFKAYSQVFEENKADFFSSMETLKTWADWLNKELQIGNCRQILLILKAKPPPQYRDKHKTQTFGFSCRISGPGRVKGNLVREDLQASESSESSLVVLFQYLLMFDPCITTQIFYYLTSHNTL